ncbi:Protein-associating with the carboxyl-terminal domain of ezrin, partial [Modicella reniformis]
MGAAESRPQGNGAVAGDGSKAKLAFAPGTQPLLATPVFTLRDAFFGKRPVSAFTYDPAQFALDNKQEFLPKAIKVSLVQVALHFLHSQCRVSHNNVQLSSIFVSNGRWVLGGMEFTGTAAESTETGLTSFLAKELLPPELQGKTPDKASQVIDLAHAVDIWQYGKLVESLIQGGLLHVKPNALPLDRMISSDPRKRPTGDVILESDLFVHNNAVSVVRYCRLKGLDKAQNVEWNQIILPRLYMLPPSIMEKFVVPQLLTQEFFAAEGFDKLYRTLFTPQPPQPLISEELYRAQVMPFMTKLWTYRQADIRMTILRLFEVYLKAVVLSEGGSDVLGQIILPEILTGLQDADPKVYLASLCGLATAIPYILLVSTLVDTDANKQKFSVKSLYEQTLIPQIMAFWISEDCTLEAKVQLVEVVMGMWCSIYTLGLHNHPAVKDMSSTLTLTLVSLLKLSQANERVELISKSCTKHSTNALFCISGPLKFLPQFLLDEDLQVREATARVISTIADQTIALIPSQDSTGEQQEQQQQQEQSQQQQLSESDANSSSSSTGTPAPSSFSTHSAQVSKIRQYCEKQQTLLPPRRAIFSRSAFGSERSLSSGSLRNYNGVDTKGGNLNTDIRSSRRSSNVSQESYMYSEQGSMRTPSIITPTLTRTGSFSGDTVSRDNLNHAATMEEQQQQQQQARTPFDKPAKVKPSGGAVQISPNESNNDIDAEILEATEEELEEELRAADEIELMKALETAKAEMKTRQVPAVQHTISQPSSKIAGVEGTKSNGHNSSAAFGWDAAGDDDVDDWDNDEFTPLNNGSHQPPSSATERPMEDVKDRLKREEDKAEKQEQLKLKRDQKQQEMQAKREARRQQKKVVSNGHKLGAVKAASSSAPSVTPKPVSSHSTTPLLEGSMDDRDGWGLDEDIDIGALAKQAVEDELFKDMGVDYRAPAYVGGAVSNETGFEGSTASISSVSSSMTLLNSMATISTTKTGAASTTKSTST